ncbi:MAG TPA: ankyrin repeat domain-containing protein [Bacteroidales bacterium]|nr:ankyrin repeat domain-containing protein [Bacteroidales bacterium]
MIKMNFLIAIIAMITFIAGCNGKSTSPEEQDSQSSTADANHQQSSDAGTGVLSNEAQQAKTFNTDRVMEAALKGKMAYISSALDNGYTVSSTDADNHTALMMAAYNGHSQIVELLLSKGANPNARDNMSRTALMYASTGPFNESVKLLLESGAEVNLVDSEEHFTALMFAAAEGQKEVVSTLLDHGADNSMVDVDGESAYDFALANGHAEVAAILK